MYYMSRDVRIKTTRIRFLGSCIVLFDALWCRYLGCACVYQLSVSFVSHTEYKHALTLE